MTWTREQLIWLNIQVSPLFDVHWLLFENCNLQFFLSMIIRVQNCALKNFFIGHAMPSFSAFIVYYIAHFLHYNLKGLPFFECKSSNGSVVTSLEHTVLMYLRLLYTESQNELRHFMRFPILELNADTYCSA